MTEKCGYCGLKHPKTQGCYPAIEKALAAKERRKITPRSARRSPPPKDKPPAKATPVSNTRRLNGRELMERDGEIARLREQEVSFRDIAEQLGCSVGSIQKSMRRNDALARDANTHRKLNRQEMHERDEEIWKRHQLGESTRETAAGQQRNSAWGAIQPLPSDHQRAVVDSGLNTHEKKGPSMLRTAIITTALIAATTIPGAHADPGQRCTPPTWNTVYGVPVGSSITCFNPDGSYQTCNSLGTTGDGPGTCFNYPAPPAPNPGGLLPINPPVPGQ